MKAIYYNIFGLGHINPTLPLVKALTDRGVEIIYHTSPARRELIEAHGAIFKNYGYDSYKASDFNPGKNFVLQTIPAAMGLLPFLKEEIEQVKPDFILYDSMAIWGYILGEIYNIPSFSTVATVALPEEIKTTIFNKQKVVVDDVNLEVIKNFKELYKIDLNHHQTLGAYGKNNIVFTAKKFNPDMFETHPAQFYYAGALKKENITSDFPFHLIRNTNKKILTMALGSILLQEDPSLISWYQAVIEAFSQDESMLLVLAVGSEENKKSLGSPPSNVLLFNHIPQSEVLKNTDIFINHGGMNSLNEALSEGVPTLVIPYSNDQFINAKRLVDLNLGLELSKENVTKDEVVKKVHELLSSSEISLNLKEMKRHFEAYPGMEGVVNYVLKNIV